MAALLKRQVPHLTEQHCVAHREDLGIDDAWKDVPIMKEVETLLRTVYSMFCRSSVKKAKFTEMVEVLEVDSLSFRPLNEVRWLSLYHAVHAFLRNFCALTEYCSKEADSLLTPLFISSKTHILTPFVIYPKTHIPTPLVI